MNLNLIITGVGGQGNVLASQIIGHAAVAKKLKVSVGETFGLSQRGGPVLSHIRLSTEKVRGPLIPKHKADIIVGIEPLESLRVVNEFGHANSIIISNSRPIYPVNVIAGAATYPTAEEIKHSLTTSTKKLYWVDATNLALDLGNPILLNVILLGVLSALDNFPLDSNDIMTTIKTLLPESALIANQKALELGLSLLI